MRRLCKVLYVLALFPLTLSAQPIEQVEQLPQESAAQEVKQEEAREREKSGEEDPMAQRQADSVDRPKEWSEEPNEFRLYGSVRVRHRWVGDENFWADGSSRVGVNGLWQYKPNQWLFGRLEAGVNVLDELDFLFNRGANSPDSQAGDSLFLRLLYVGIETPNFILTGGKNWSTYYRISAFTDRFQGTGASASGTYNAGTDGGPTGTGRADRVLQTRILFGRRLERVGLKAFNLNIQVQYDEPIPKVPDANYGTTIGLSAMLATRKDLSVGFAYNHASIANEDIPSLRPYGIDGDAQAGILGVRWFSENWYLASIVARLKNHETTDEGNYFDGWGWEVYGHYNLYRRWWTTAGWNILEPDSDQTQAGDYNVKYGVIGLRYSFREFQQMLYANVRLESSHLTDGSRIKNVYTIGVRWDLP